MNIKNHGFSYFLNWVLLGAIAGVVILYSQGHIKFNIPTETAVDNIGDRLQTITYSEAVALAAPAVVYIQAITHIKASGSNGSTLLERFLGLNSPHRQKTKTVASSGSGVILDTAGYILTNYHVIKDADEIILGLYDGQIVNAQMVGKDVETDLAVLKIEVNNLPEIKIADVMKSRIGDIVLAIGYPFTIGQTVTQGIISATGKTRVSSITYENYIQTDAAINPGNSGGALINASGEIVGINSLIYTKTGGFQGIGFAIPIDIAFKVLNQIKEHGYVVRGWLGVEGQEVPKKALKQLNLSVEQGIILTALDRGGPADLAGLKRGDIITHINKKSIATVHDVMNIIAEGQPGEIMEISGLRMRQSFTANVTLGERPMASK